MFLWFWVFFKEKFQNRRIQPKQSTSAKGVRREIVILLFLIIFTAIDALIYFLQLKGIPNIY